MKTLFTLLLLVIGFSAMAHETASDTLKTEGTTVIVNCNHDTCHVNTHHSCQCYDCTYNIGEVIMIMFIFFIVILLLILVITLFFDYPYYW